MRKLLILLTLLFTINGFTATTTWNGISWNNGIPAFNDDAIINGNYSVGITNGTNNFLCKSLIVNNGFTFTIKTGFYVNVGNNNGGGDFINNGTVIVEANSDFWIYAGSLINNSGPNNFIIENGGGMIQLNNSAVNSGNITLRRNTNPVKTFEYTYWSSPVSNQNTNLLPPSNNLNTVYTYSFPTPAPMNGWLELSNSTIMQPGKGYAVRGPWCSPYPTCFGSLPQITHTMNFIGLPNNGNFIVNSTSTNNFHLIGNPYPSSLDMRGFIQINSQVNFISLWTHNTLLSSAISGNWTYNFTPDDYAIYNLTGGVSASSPINDGTPNNSATPTRYIGSGQGFFVTTNSNGTSNFSFSNSLRGYLPNANNSQFFREIIEENRVWLFITNNSLITRYNLIGYVTGADNGFNEQYDADIMNGRVASFYSILSDKKLAIQGRALPFDNNDIIPLGYNLPESGTYQIGINSLDGLFLDNSLPIYLEDLELGVIHNLRNGNYSFSVTAGVNETRFRLRFNNSTLGNEDFLTAHTVIYSNYGINIKNDLENIKKVSIFDTLGRLVYEKDYNDHFVNFQLNTKGVYIIKIKFEDGNIVEKKVIN